MSQLNLLQGDSLKKLKELDDNSIDSVVTDPPYGLKFMNKKWDHQVPSTELWREVYRVLKPGGHLLSFAGTRTYHRMAVNIEDAGFEIRDQLQWLYGSGFPKSMNISKAIDKAAGAKREVVGLAVNSYPDSGRKDIHRKGGGKVFNQGEGLGQNVITAPATPEAKQWDGFGTALKPANEPIVLARKPLSEKTVAKNVLKWRTGGLNIDGCRVGPNPGYKYKNGHGGNSFSAGKGVDGTRSEPVESTQGRWPANVLLDETAAEVLDKQTQHLHGAGSARKGSKNPRKENHQASSYTMNRNTGDMHRFGDSGGASRFFYVAKASKKERTNKGEVENKHPTVKPIKLMAYLARLVTPPGGTVLDPFMGSGSTGLAAVQEGFSFVGVELDGEYFDIAKARLKYTDKKTKEEKYPLLYSAQPSDEEEF